MRVWRGGVTLLEALAALTLASLALAAVAAANAAAVRVPTEMAQRASAMAKARSVVARFNGEWSIELGRRSGAWTAPDGAAGVWRATVAPYATDPSVFGATAFREIRVVVSTRGSADGRDRVWARLHAVRRIR